MTTTAHEDQFTAAPAPAPAVPAVLNQREGNVTAAAIAFFQAERDYNYAYLRSSGSKVFELQKAVQNTRKQLEEAMLQSADGCSSQAQNGVGNEQH